MSRSSSVLFLWSKAANELNAKSENSFFPISSMVSDLLTGMISERIQIPSEFILLPFNESSETWQVGQFRNFTRLVKPFSLITFEPKFKNLIVLLSIIVSQRVANPTSEIRFLEISKSIKPQFCYFRKTHIDSTTRSVRSVLETDIFFNLSLSLILTQN